MISCTFHRGTYESLSQRGVKAVTARIKNSLVFASIAAVLLVALWLLERHFEERPTEVRIAGGAAPVFVLSGSGDLEVFSVYLVSSSDFAAGREVKDLSDDSFFAEPPAWRIEAQPDPMHGRRVEDIGDLEYGVVPLGYKQEIPSNGSLPRPVVEGKQYFFHCETTKAPPASGGFEIIGGKAVSVDLELPCLEGRNGKEVAVPCPKYPN
jgi:hypothetical protein